MSRTPYVSVMPGMYHGEPCVNGHRLPTRMIADHVFDGVGDTAEFTWDITRDEVLVACWFEARYGQSRKMRKAWAGWLEAWSGVLWTSDPAHWATVPMPPIRAIGSDNGSDTPDSTLPTHESHNTAGIGTGVDERA